jgi:class 3 adenylate cyclase
MVDKADHRIGDAERQQAIDLLRAHTGAGRLTLDEFSELAGDVYAAQTYGELEAVGRKLPPGLLSQPGEPAADAGARQAGPSLRPPVDAPATATAAPGAAAAGAAPPAGTAPPAAAAPGAAPAAGAGERTSVVAVMCGAHPRGRWRPAASMRAIAFWGGAHIDLRDAVFPGPVLDIRAWAVMGGITITVPEGTPVELDGLVVMGGWSDHTRRTDATPGAPVVRVHARGLWGAVEVRNPSRKKSVKRALAAEADRLRDEVDLRAQSLLEVPQRILDDVDALLHDRMDGREPAHHRHRHGRTSPPHSPRAPWPPNRPPWPWPWPPPTGGSVRDRAQSDGAPTEPPSGTLTMMVTDVVDSTQLAERLGDRRWIRVMAEHNALVRDQVTRHGGTEVKALGDGFLVVFRSARRAILSAVDVQRALASYRDAHPDTPVTVRIGLHTGEIVDVDGDVFGQNVVVASRIADKAEPGEIVVSGLTRDLTVAGGDLTFGPPDDVELKGLSQRWRVHRVSWAPTAPATPATPAP